MALNHSFLLDMAGSPGETADQIRDTYQTGIKTFGALFTRLMDANGFSHPQMVSLTRSCLDGVSWLHSSQISGLRHCKLISPGPRTLIAIERLNFYLHRFQTQKKLLPNTSSSNAYSEAWAVTEDGEPPSLGWWMEVFCGQRVPKDIDLFESFFTSETARTTSTAWGTLVRKLFIQQELDLITQLDETLRNSYPAGDHHRMKKVRDVVMGQDTWSPDELQMELPAITALTASLGGPTTEDDLLVSLS